MLVFTGCVSLSVGTSTLIILPFFSVHLIGVGTGVSCGVAVGSGVCILKNGVERTSAVGVTRLTSGAAQLVTMKIVKRQEKMNKIRRIEVRSFPLDTKFA